MKKILIVLGTVVVVMLGVAGIKGIIGRKKGCC